MYENSFYEPKLLSIPNMKRMQCDRKYSGVKIYSDENKKDILELEFVIQPILSSLENTVYAYEMLSKVSVNTFFDSELTVEEIFFCLEERVIKQIALTQIDIAKKIERQLGNALISVNVPVSLLTDNGFVDLVISRSPSNLAIEIDVLRYSFDNPIIVKNIDRFRNYGIKLWLDDYLVLSHASNVVLTEVEWDLIKIDKSYFSNKLNEKITAKVLTDRVNEHSKDGVIFEGVETIYQRSEIALDNVYLQGYYLSYPISVGEILRMIESQ
ncbi:EAL domain-containing protein [Vibrio mediterranei]